MYDGCGYQGLVAVARLKEDKLKLGAICEEDMNKTELNYGDGITRKSLMDKLKAKRKIEDLGWPSTHARH